MNAKARQYYQEINKENLLCKQYRVKNNQEKTVNKASCKALMQHNHAQQNSRVREGTPKLRNQKNQNMESKKNIIGKLIHSKDKNGGVKFPRIVKEEVGCQQTQKQKRSKSFKKMLTEPAGTDDQLFQLKTMSPKKNMKQILLEIVKNKENRHLLSIDEQIDKLDVLTKRYSFLRKDLVSIQEDMLTMSFKQKIGRESESVSSVFMN